MTPRSAAATEVLPPPLASVASRLGLLHDLQVLESALQETYADQPPGLARACARHLLADRGKRVRPFLCMLAARLRGPASRHQAARALAQAGELVHSSTLLHDDVIDLGEQRRGRPAARVLYGNGASVLGGDLLLVEALALVEGAGVPGAFVPLLDVLRSMVNAEALQLELRGRTDVSIDDYFRVCLGKTAALFEWVLEAGARAGGANPPQVAALGRYGRELGVAFQLVDDLLDLTGDSHAVGKSVLQDIRQGTITYPTIAALREEPELAARVLAAADGGPTAGLGADLLAAMARHGGLTDARRQVTLHTERARAALETLPDSAARQAFDSFVTELADRSR